MQQNKFSCFHFFYFKPDLWLVGTYILHYRKSFGGKAREAQQQKNEGLRCLARELPQVSEKSVVFLFPEHALHSAVFCDYGCGQLPTFVVELQRKNSQSEQYRSLTTSSMLLVKMQLLYFRLRLGFILIFLATRGNFLDY